MKDRAGWAKLPAFTRQKRPHFFPAGEIEALCRKAFLHEEATPRASRCPSDPCAECLRRLEAASRPRAAANARRTCIGCANPGMTERATDATPLLASVSPPLCASCIAKYDRIGEASVQCRICGATIQFDDDGAAPHAAGCKALERSCPRCDARPRAAGRQYCGPCTTETLREVHRAADAETPPPTKRGSRTPRWDSGVSGSWDDSVRRTEG